MRELEKPIGTADNHDSNDLQHGTAALRNDICTRSGTADFHDEIYIRNGKSVSGSIFYPACPHAKPENRLGVSIVFMTDVKLIRAFCDCATR